MQMQNDYHSKTPKHRVPGFNEQNNLFGNDKPGKYVIESDGEQISFSEIPAHQNPCVPDMTYTQSQITDLHNKKWTHRSNQEMFDRQNYNKSGSKHSKQSKFSIL